MTGHIKVSGVWQNITAPSVKIAGTWKQVIQAWTKVGGSWVQWYIATITDTFTRADTGSGLGTSDSGALWSAIRGIFFISSNKAKSNDSAATYPIAVVDSGVTTPSINLDTDTAGGGTGISFWVSDTQNWYGVFPFVATSTSYGQSCATYTQSAASYSCTQVSGPNYGAACQGYASTYGQQCQGFTTTYGQTCDGFTTTYGQQCQGFSTTYGQTCIQWSNISYGNTIICSGGWQQRYDGLRGYYYQVCLAYANQQTSSGGGCIDWSQTSGTSCTGGYSQTSSNSCTGGYSQTSANSCTGGYAQTGPNYTCPGGYIQSGPSYSCGIVNGPNYSALCSAYTQTSANSAGQVSLRLIRSVANVVSTLVDQAISALPASLQVLISGNQITARAYSGVGQTTQIGSDLVNTPSSPITATQHGLIIAPGGYNQGTTADNLTVSAVQ
jgi:hypothetical protein